MRLFNAAGQQVATNDNGTSLDSGLTFPVATTGKYFVGVSAADNSTYDPNQASSGSGSSFTTDYQLSFEIDAAASVAAEVEPNDTIDTPNAIDVGTSVAGSIATSADSDFYMFTVTDAGQFNAQATADSVAISPDQADIRADEGVCERLEHVARPQPHVFVAA